MKNKFMKFKIATIGVLMTATLVGCSTMGNKKLNSQDQEKFVKQVTTMVSERKHAVDVENVLDTKIKQLDVVNATTVVNAYTYSIYQENTNMTSKISALTPDLQDLVKNKKLDLSKDITGAYSFEDGMVKGLFQELEKDHLKLQQDGSTFFANVDIDYVIKKYGTMIDSNLKDFMEFRSMEGETLVFNSEATTFNLDEIAKRLVTIEGKSSAIKNSKFKDQWISAQQYYYNILFGVNHQYFYEKTADKDKKDTATQTVTNQTKLQDKVVSQYKDIIKKNPNTQLTKDLQGYVDILSKTGNKVEATATTYTNQLMTKKFSTETTDSKTSNAPAQSDSEAQSKIDAQQKTDQTTK